MRVSVHPKDSGYDTWRELCLNQQSVEVYYDGKFCPFVVTADDVKKVVIHFVADERGKRIHLNRDGSFTRVRKQRGGNVEIRVI